MKKIFGLPLLMLFAIALPAQSIVQWISTSPTEQWKKQPVSPTSTAVAQATVAIQLNQPLQTIDGFGTCFNELG